MSKHSHKLDLPVELEREIFEVAAQADIATALSLALVARRVQAWVDPIIYSTFVVAPRDDTHMSVVRAILPPHPPAAISQNLPRAPSIPVKPAGFFARHVKCLYIANLSEAELVTVLRTCTGISELGWVSSTVTAPGADALCALDFRRLHVDQSFDFHRFHGLRPFATLTHLDLKFPIYLPPLDRFTSLTHLSATFRWQPSMHFFEYAFQACPLLEILLVFIRRTIWSDYIVGSVFFPQHSDPRVVVMEPPGSDQWSARYVQDGWLRAEDIVRERRNLAAEFKDHSDDS